MGSHGCVSVQWHTFDLDATAMTLANHRVHCITLPDLPAEFRETIDRSLKRVAGYIGAFEIDPGNPIQGRAFSDLLVYDAAIIEGQIVREVSVEGGQDTPFMGADQFKPKGSSWREMGWLVLDGPPDIPKMELSERGRITASLIERKRRGALRNAYLQDLSQLLGPTGR